MTAASGGIEVLETLCLPLRKSLPLYTSSVMLSDPNPEMPSSSTTYNKQHLYRVFIVNIGKISEMIISDSFLNTFNEIANIHSFCYNKSF